MASLFGSTTAKPAAAPKPMGLDATRTSSNEQAVALRYFAGIQRFALTWLGPAYNQRTKEVKSGGGGKGAGNQTTGHDYYADVAGLACLGIVDSIREIWMNQELVWSGNLARGDDSASIDIEKKGHVTIFWGTETQTAPSTLAANGHPPYRGQCYLFFEQLYFGRDTTSAPNIEVVLLRQPGNVGLSTASEWQADTNPAHCMIELLTHPRYGLGWNSVDTLDLASWDAAAAQLRAEGFGLSPLIDRAQTARTLLTQFCEYFDGYLVAVDGGRLALQLARPHGSPDDLPLLGEYDLLEVPDPAPTSWRATTNEVNVRFTDRDNQYQADSEPCRDLANLRVVGGEALTQNLDRPWITRRAQAQTAAAWALRVNSVPWVNSTIEVRKEAADGIEPGSFVQLTYQDYLETLVMRVVRRRVTDDKSQAVELTLRADGFFNDLTPYTPDRPPLPDVPEIPPQPPAFSRIIELPWPLVPAGSNLDQPHLSALVARAGQMDVKFFVYSSEDDLSYDEVTHHKKFVIAGTLAADYPVTNILDDSADGMLLTLSGVDGATDLETTNNRGRQKMRLLVFVEDEIIAYRDVQIVPGGVRLIGLRRACYDTLVAAHAAGTPVAIVRRKNMRDFTESTYERNDVVDFKVATATALAMLDLAGVDAQEITLANRTARPICPINLRVNGVGASCTYASGADLLIEWDAASWRRHEFWQAWEDSYADDKLKHRVRICADGGGIVKAVKVGPGVLSYTLTNADLQAAFGGSEPAALRVRVLARRRGQRSLSFIEQRVVKS